MKPGKLRFTLRFLYALCIKIPIEALWAMYMHDKEAMNGK